MQRRTFRAFGLVGWTAALLLIVTAGPAEAAPTDTTSATVVSGSVQLEGGAAASIGDTVVLARYISTRGKDPLYKQVAQNALRADGTYSFKVSRHARYGIAVLTNNRGADSDAGYYSTFAGGEAHLASLDSWASSGTYNQDWFLSWRGTSFAAGAGTPATVHVGTTTLHRGGWIAGQVTCLGKTLDVNSWGVAVHVPGLGEEGNTQDREIEKTIDSPQYRTEALPVGTYAVHVESYNGAGRCATRRATAQVTVRLGETSTFGVNKGVAGPLVPKPRITGTARVGHVVTLRTSGIPADFGILSALIGQTLYDYPKAGSTYRIRRSAMTHPADYNSRRAWQVDATVQYFQLDHWDNEVSLSRRIAH